LRLGVIDNAFPFDISAFVTIQETILRLRTIGLIVTLALGLLAGSLPAEAQKAEKVHRIGLLISASNVIPLFTDAFRQGMRELGYVEEKNYVLEIRGGRAKRDQYAAELVRLKVDIIVTVGFPALRAAKEATSTIPIVMRTGSDPVRRGLVASLAHPGGNLTGRVAMSVELSAKRLELLTETVPRAKRIAVLTAARKGRTYKELEAAARALGVKLQILRARDPSEIDNAFLTMIKEQADALLVIPSARYSQHRERIVKHAAKNRLPSIYSHRRHVESGGLMSYGVNYLDEYRRTAIYVDKILRGANPGELPIEQPTKFQLVINLKTAKQLGITIPPEVLYQATKVIK
jgi:putative ABC transport system substrate-binding protein